MSARTLVLAGLLTILSVTLIPNTSHALGLKVAPLEYKVTLKKGEHKKGFIDVSNPSGQTVKVKTSVQALRQINDDGGLQFYTDKQVRAGIITDLPEFELGPREALRMYFHVNGASLPKGDVYAAIFFTTVPKQPKNGVGQLVRVGTLLSIVNGNPGNRTATITKLNLPFFQLSDTVNGSYSIKNTASPNSGFYPLVKLSAWPGVTPKNNESSLIFGGRERENDFSYKTGIGLHYVEISHGNSKKGQWVVTLTPWVAVGLIVITLIIATELVLWRRKKTSTRPSS